MKQYLYIKIHQDSSSGLGVKMEWIAATFTFIMDGLSREGASSSTTILSREQLRKRTRLYEFLIIYIIKYIKIVWCPGQNKRIALSLSCMDVVKDD
jgi:hypothetical protein